MPKELHLAILGGSSVSTPILVFELWKEALKGTFSNIEIKLYGRNLLRLERILTYITYTFKSKYKDFDTNFNIKACSEIEDAVKDAEFILCQIRPGGMEGRAHDEKLALSEGIPGDEGLGPSGLCAYLRGKKTMEEIASTCFKYAPNAIFLQMSSPLSLFTALVNKIYKNQTYGICELPVTTANTVSQYVSRHSNIRELSYSLMGTNHLSWLYNFRGKDGIDRTSQVIKSIISLDAISIQHKKIEECQAIPMPYMKLIFHRQKSLNEQISKNYTRGEQLLSWVDQLDSAYLNDTEPDYQNITSLLKDRNINWYNKGVVPILKTLLTDCSSEFPLNIPNNNILRDIPKGIVYETLCNSKKQKIRPLSAPLLPKIPLYYTRKLFNYDFLVLNFSSRPKYQEIASALEIHPMVPENKLSKISRKIYSYTQNISL